MSKNIIIGLIAVVVLAIGGYVVVTQNKPAAQSPSTSNTTSTSSNTENSSVKLASQTVGKPADCSTYSFSELQKVWGVPFVDTDINNVSALSSDGGKLYSCGYNETDSGTGVTFTIEYREHPNVDSAKQSMNDTRSTEKYGDTVYYLKEDKAGVGDEAFFWARNRTDSSKEVNQQMYIRKGTVVFLLSGVNLSGVDTSYKDKLLASYRLHFQ
ncbi:MAG: hypothetical protein WBB39_00190 [Candidatus Saccharimonadales bacterium]